ncbi:MAG: hypothetical protein KatS3mg017_0278 [Fimbriimonadales bacterium]|nr:MAG: hypothetical protein KatS3mg017_0278 [Fimbriimonadales bacterium]
MRTTILSIGILLTLTSWAQTLKVGDPAPALPVTQWVKGQPVKELELGKVYVVEFWATWCGPCRQTIPHLTKLAEKYQNKVTVIGVSVWERTDPNNPTAHVQTVQRFVESMGDKMNYTVAVDSADGAIAKAWMEAAQQDGIPTAFVIDPQKRIVWIGHPMDNLDGVLEQVVAGTFDWKAEAERQKRAREQQEALQKDFTEFTQLMQAGKSQDALKKLDEMIPQYPDVHTLKMVRFETLLRVDEKQAYAYAQQLAETTFKEMPEVLNMLAWTIVDDNTRPPLKSPNYPVAIAIAQRAAELTKEQDASILDTLAYAYFKNGDVQNALKYQKMALDLVEKDTTMDETLKKDIRDRYEKFKKAAESK